MEEGVEWSEASLFSLELVVEKLYLPHVVCRFPAVAFRLLDFPTIVIKHVEDELASRIKKKISLDKYYELPDQFGELKDKFGNFMIKKGKSCLFKIGLKTFRDHMSNTPLYVMMLDTFPEVPKLVANTTVSLERLVESICDSTKKHGSGVPTVEGDKGLFKLYSLMGKEVGYVIVGYRLLSLGPSLIPHINIDRQFDKHETHIQNPTKTEINIDPLKEDTCRLLHTKEMGSMTEELKADALSQTTNHENIATNMEVRLKGDLEDTREMAINTCPDIAVAFTQTERTLYPSRNIKKKPKIIEGYVNQPTPTDTFCPPPLFYNSNALPQYKKVQPFKEYTSDSETISLSDDLTVEDISSDDEEKTKVENNARVPLKDSNVPFDHPIRKEKPDHCKINIFKRDSKDPAQGLNDQNTFPLLSALISELTKIQNPQIQTVCNQFKEHSKKVIQQTHQSGIKDSKPRENKATKQPFTSHSNRKVSEPVEMKEINAQDLKKVNSDLENAIDTEALDHFSGRQSHKDCAHPHPGVPKNKGWIRNVPQSNVKKSKLTFRMTNAHRLRLEKSNPKWLKSVENEKGIRRDKRTTHGQSSNKDDDEFFNETHLSDAFTEIRNHTDDDVKEIEQSEKNDDKTSPKKSSSSDAQSPRTRKHSPKRNDKRSKASQKSSPASKPSSSKSTVRSLKSHDKHIKNTSGDKPSKIEKKELGSSSSKSTTNKKFGRVVSTDEISEASAKSIEVRVPSVDQVYDDSDWESSQNDEFEDEQKSLPRPSAFPGFVDGNMSMPDTIGGRPNDSLNVSRDTGDTPLESTRYSKDYQADNNRESKLSTDDFTRRTFHSTDELELQQLMSDTEKYDSDFEVSQHSRSIDNRSAGDRSFTKASAVSSQKFLIRNPVVSDSSPVPATRRSQVRLDLERATLVETPQSHIQTARTSPDHPTPTPRVPKMKKPLERTHLPSIHTDSLSSYAPSDPENVTFSQSYSDDFNLSDSESILDILSSNEAKRPRFIPSTKLGYTIG